MADIFSGRSGFGQAIREELQCQTLFVDNASRLATTSWARPSSSSPAAQFFGPSSSWSTWLLRALLLHLPIDLPCELQAVGYLVSPGYLLS
eukprot:1290881-Pyramimonas_sp.AAC.1